MANSCSFLHSKVVQISACVCVCMCVGGGGGGRGGVCPCASVCLVSVRVCMHACKCACVCLWCVCAQIFYTCWIPSVKKQNKQQPKTNNKTVCWVLQNYAYLWAKVYYSISISTDTACLKTAPWLSWLCMKKGVGVPFCYSVLPPVPSTHQSKSNI